MANRSRSMGGLSKSPDPRRGVLKKKPYSLGNPIGWLCNLRKGFARRASPGLNHWKKESFHLIR